MTAAADKRKPAKSKFRGRMPTKRTINLMLVDEGKVKASKAIPAILAIIALAALFSKFLVADRLASVSAAQARVARLQTDVDSARAALDEIGGVEQTYAHYTLADMTQAELDMVDRTQVLELVGGILPPPIPVPDGARLDIELRSLFRPAPVTGNAKLDQARAANRLAAFMQTIPTPEYVINSWNVSENLLTLEISGRTLERLNELGRHIEQSPIVDSCTISTANMDQKKLAYEGTWARFLVYLRQAPAEEPAAAPETGEEASQP